MRRLTERGDTIVEVLITVALITLVLATAYATSNRSVKNSMQSQEHSNALKLAETQLDLLKAYALQNGTNSPSAVPFCLKVNVSNQIAVYNAATAPECRIVNGSLTYAVNISLSGSVFTTKVTWPSLISGTDQVSLVYRLQ